MARALVEPAYRAFCLGVEVAYGTAEDPSTNVVKFEDTPTMGAIKESKSDANEYTGFAHRMEHSILQQSVNLVHTRRLLPWEAGLFLSLLGGSTVPHQWLGTGAYVHLIENDITALECKSTTMWEDTPSHGQKEFPGICCTQVVVDFARGEYCNAAYTLVGDGSVAAGDALAAIGVDDAAELYLKYGDITVNIGGNYSEDGDLKGTIAGPTDITALTRSGTITLKNNAESVYELGAADIYADNVIKGDMKADDFAIIDLEIEPADDTYLAYLLAETTFEFEVQIVGAVMVAPEDAYYYTVSFLFPECRTVETTMDKDGSTQIASVKIMALQPSTAAWPVWQAQVTNRVVAYLV